MMTHPRSPGWLTWLKSPTGLLAAAALALFIVYVLAEHGAHVVPLLPFGLILLCPLMHLFMHGGHGGHARSQGARHEHADR
jgi:hypothetical protein